MIGSFNVIPNAICLHKLLKICDLQAITHTLTHYVTWHNKCALRYRWLVSFTNTLTCVPLSLGCMCWGRCWWRMNTMGGSVRMMSSIGAGRFCYHVPLSFIDWCIAVCELFITKSASILLYVNFPYSKFASTFSLILMNHLSSVIIVIIDIVMEICFFL